MSLLLLFNAPAAPPSGSTGTAFYSFVEAGMFLGQWEIDDYLTFTACIHSSTGAAAIAVALLLVACIAWLAAQDNVTW